MDNFQSKSKPLQGVIPYFSSLSYIITSEIRDPVLEVFNVIDADSSNGTDKAKTKKFFHGDFAELSASEMFIWMDMIRMG